MKEKVECIYVIGNLEKFNKKISEFLGRLKFDDTVRNEVIKVIPNGFNGQTEYYCWIFWS